jgi:hypothetical protein
MIAANVYLLQCSYGDYCKVLAVTTDIEKAKNWVVTMQNRRNAMFAAENVILDQMEMWDKNNPRSVWNRQTGLSIDEWHKARV